MESLHQLLTQRRSIRRYTKEPIDAEQVKLILEAALMGPTSKSSRSWQFVAVDDPAVLSALADCKPTYATSIREAPLAVVVVGDPSKSEAWIEDASIAASFMMLQAVDLGLGACWVQVLGRTAADGTPSEEVIRETLGIPAEFRPVCVVTIGHPDEQRRTIDTDKLKWEKVHIERWKTPNQPQQ